MTPITSRDRLLTGLSTVLLGISLVLLVAGHFFSWNDVSGFQSERWNYTFGDLAALAAVVGAGVALVDPVARRWAGAMVASFVALLVVLEVVAPHFAFVGSGDVTGLLAFEIGLGIAALVLLTPRFVRRRAEGERRPWPLRLTGWARLDSYLVFLVFVAPVVLLVVTSHLDTAGHPECGGSGDACIEEYQAFFDAFVAWCGLVVAIVIAEVALGVRRHRRHRHA